MPGSNGQLFRQYESNVGDFHYPDGAAMTVFSLDDEGNLWAAGSAAAGPYLLAVEVSDNGLPVQRQTVSVTVNIQAAVSVTVVRSIPHNLRVNSEYFVGTAAIIGLLPNVADPALVIEKVEVPFLGSEAHVDFVGGIAIIDEDEEGIFDGIYDLRYDRGGDNKWA